MIKSSANSKFQILYFIFVLFIVSFALMPTLASAAEIYFKAKTTNIISGQQFQIDVLMNTENKAINAIEGKILFPGDLLELKEIQDGNSIINFWIERPLALDKTGAEIVFSGITPGGYIGEKGLIFSAVFQTKKQGRGVIEIHDAKSLLNDGKGTETSLKISNFQFSISEQIPNFNFQIPDSKIDIDPPELFIPKIASDPALFNEKWFLVFATQDKGSGIDYYEVREGRGKFIRAESPYLLQNQDLNKKITVKAIDKSGNERIAVLPALHPSPWYKNYSILIILIIIVAYIIRRFLWRKRGFRI